MKKVQYIGIITMPIVKAGCGPLSNLIDIVYQFSDFLYVITGNEGMDLRQKYNQKIHILGIQYRPKVNFFAKIINHVYLQLRISFKIIRLAKSVNLWIFFLDSHALFLPVLTSRLMKKKIIFILAASIVRTAKTQMDSLANVLVYSEAINYKLSNYIILYSPNLIKEWYLEKYKNKILIASEHFINLNTFSIKKEINQRNAFIGYIGRLSKEKGVLNYLQAILILLKQYREDQQKQSNDLRFFVGGDGQLRKNVEEYLNMEGMSERLQFIGWIPHEELPKYFNQLKLIIIPSYTEGLPNIMLEAMACGTPVLATIVGAIPDVIKDGETGFILEDNSPETIAKGIIRVLNHPNLEQIAANARALVEQEYTFEAAVERWRKILAEVL